MYLSTIFSSIAKRIILFFPLFFSIQLNAQFEKYFEDKTLRIDYKHSGNKYVDTIWLDEFIKIPANWAGSLTQLIDPFDYGDQRIRVIDPETKDEIYTRTYSTLFKEWRMTPMAKDSIMIFEECMLIPYPNKPVEIELQSRHENKFVTINTFHFIPTTTKYTERHLNNFPIKKLLYSGDPHKKLDIVIVPDGYALKDSSKMQKDFELFKKAILRLSPFSENEKNINIWGVEVFSDSSGITNPNANKYRSTVVSSTFNVFEIDRYLMTFALKKLHDAISDIPYEQIIIMSNTKKYGGGAIYNFYSAIAAAPFLSLVVPHELGHAFGNLGDEYVDNTVSYNELYLSGYEPNEPNITNLVNFESKWKDMIDSNTPIPTPNEKKYESTIGLFEGAGYVSKGVYRPYYNCMMRSGPEMCPVCKKSINKMFKLYTE